MLNEYRRILLLTIPIAIAIAIFPVSFDGKQVVSLDAPITSTFDLLVKNLWKLHPFIIDVKELQKLNTTCSYYEITDRIPFIRLLNISFQTKYYTETNVDQNNFCISSFVSTQLNIMTAYHQYCMHTNTIQTSKTIVTDQFHGKSWMIFKSYIKNSMFLSHKQTLQKLRNEMSVYSFE